MKHKFSFIFFVFLFVASSARAQSIRRVLFLGNSYTAYNNLPQLVKDVASSAGDSLIFDSNTPGGYTLQNHVANPTSMGKIMLGNWDYVVLQGQSQEPIVQNSIFNNNGLGLDDTITQYNPCAKTMFYMTWGRKNGDASNCPFFPVMCTYSGMDTSLRDAYTNLASIANAELSPVGILWNYLRQNYPSIELYQADESHPSLAGSYAAACCFYATIFKHDPTLITFNPGLSAADAAIIRNAAKTEIFDYLPNWDFMQMPLSNIQFTIGAGTNELIFSPVNFGISQTYFWDFGDGFTSTLANPTHSYLTNGTYFITLTTTNCDLQGLHTSTSDTLVQFCTHTPSITIANPWLCEYDTLWTEVADSYQWYSGGLEIPVTTQYLHDYSQYNSTGFSVQSTVSGCTELSQIYNAIPEWSGYYFDAAMGGDPCEGDTALFTVLHISSLVGTEIIHWYKNDTLLAFANNQDTLFITTAGNYYCTVINPASTCPFDTTISPVVSFDCTLGTENIEDIIWKIYPNPASENVTVEFLNNILVKKIVVYDATGRLIKTMEITSSHQFNVTDWPAGFYYIRIANAPKQAFKLIKL